MPWTSWNEALDREMNFYQQCPVDHGYPRFVLATFLDGDWIPSPDRTDTIPATQNGMGILSYLKYHALRGKQDPRLLQTARAMGDYLVKETLTPASGQYPAFTRSTGKRDRLPVVRGLRLPKRSTVRDRARQGRHRRLRLVAAVRGGRRAQILGTGLQNARVLAANQKDGDAAAFALAVSRRLSQRRRPRAGVGKHDLHPAALRCAAGAGLRGIRRSARARCGVGSGAIRFPSAAADGALFAQFFEDHDTPTNRTAWAPLNLARYLLETRRTARSRLARRLPAR